MSNVNFRLWHPVIEVAVGVYVVACVCVVCVCGVCVLCVDLCHMVSSD